MSLLTFEQAQEALTEIADRIPAPIFEGLNGGIILLPEAKLHPESVRGDLYILGEYHYDPQGFGRYITLYYGSFQRAHGRLPDDRFVEKLRDTLHHELTHHLEHRAGDKSLEIRDAIDLAQYHRKQEDQKP